MGLFSKDTPQAPDPIRTAAAATATNVSTSVANAYLNNVNQVTPQGALTYNKTSDYSWTDPTTGQTYTIPGFTATQSLSPDQQDISNLNVQADKNLAGLASNQSGMLQGLLGSPFNFNGAPGTGDINWLNAIGYASGDIANVGEQQRNLGNAGALTRSYGPGDFSQDRQRVEESMYQRMSPQLERDRQRMEAQLADQGIRGGDPGWQASMEQFNKQLADTRLGITAAGGAEQQRMMEMAAQRAGFENAAQQQAFTQLLQGGQFSNQAQQQAFQQAGLRTQAYNAAQAQNMARNQAIFGAQNQLRGQYIQEQQALRNQPINEITALLSGSQVSQPNWISTNQQNIPVTDTAGLINNKFSQEMDTYRQQSANFNSLMGGIFGAIGGLARSDRREKENIDKVGSIFAAGPDGEKPLPVYEYSFKDDPASTRHIGPMAQDVERIDPKAVKTIKGTKYIDRTRLGSILKVA